MAILKNKLKAGDQVIVIAGKYKGHRGPVIKISQQERKRADDRLVALVEGVTRKKHVKANPDANIEGGIKDVPFMIDVSNLAIVNPDTDAADRIGYRINDDGVKVRFYKKSGKDVEKRGDR